MHTADGILLASLLPGAFAASSKLGTRHPIPRHYVIETLPMETLPVPRCTIGCTGPQLVMLESSSMLRCMQYHVHFSKGVHVPIWIICSDRMSHAHQNESGIQRMNLMKHQNVPYQKCRTSVLHSSIKIQHVSFNKVNFRELLHHRCKMANAECNPESRRMPHSSSTLRMRRTTIRQNLTRRNFHAGQLRKRLDYVSKRATMSITHQLLWLIVVFTDSTWHMEVDDATEPKNHIACCLRGGSLLSEECLSFFDRKQFGKEASQKRDNELWWIMKV